MMIKNEVYFLIAIKFPQDSLDLVEESIDELERLVKTAGGNTIGSFIAQRRSIDPAYFIGKGKLLDIDLLFDSDEKEKLVIVFNSSLTFSQVRNIEELLNVRVITRRELILDIFALHAKSKISQLQVEKAQLSYLLPKLVGKRSQLSRTGAGIGTRGPGETKLETDRRKIRKRIDILKKELKLLEKSRQECRKSRQDIFKVAVAGYTNAGKSSLLSQLVGQSLYVADDLFATLDTTTRKLRLGGIPAVITDTVGFIKDIPHELVESFHSTLQETINADLILHVIDLSSPFYQDKIDVAQELMDQIKVKSPVVLIFNKIDLVSQDQKILVQKKYPKAFFLSAKDKESLNDLIIYLKQATHLFFVSKGFDISKKNNYLD